MRTQLNILIAVIMIALVSVPSAYSREWNEAQIHQEFLNDPVFSPANGDTLVGDIDIPADLQPPLQGGTYTIEFQPGVSVFFRAADGGAGGSLTITTQDVQGGNAVGRINAHGTEGDLVQFSGVNNGQWGGIAVETSPQGGNLVSHCSLDGPFARMEPPPWFNGGMPAVYIDGEDAQCVVEYCTIDCNGMGLAVGASGGLYSIRDNEISDGNFAIWVLNAMAGNPQQRETAVVRNTISNSFEPPLYLGHWDAATEWNGTASNNLVVDAQGITAILIEETADARVFNNTVVNAWIGIQGIAAWPADVQNNIIVNCNTGFTANVEDEVNFNMTFQCQNNLGGDLDEGQNNLFGVNPQFENHWPFGDYYLGHESPAIDTGNEDYGNDLNFTPNDRGAYGGPNADPEMASRWFGTVVPGQHHGE